MMALVGCRSRNATQNTGTAFDMKNIAMKQLFLSIFGNLKIIKLNLKFTRINYNEK